MQNKLIKIIFFAYCWMQLIFLLSSCKKKNDGDCPNCPSVLSISPDQAYGGDTISLSGRNFSSDSRANIVKFNGFTVSSDSIISGSSTHLSVVVPISCGTGPVTVDLDAELTNSGTPPTFTYLYKATVSTFAGAWDVGMHIVNTSIGATRFTSPGGIVIYDDVIFVKDGIDNITKISNFTQSSDVTLGLGTNEDIGNIFSGTGKVYYVKSSHDLALNYTYTVQDITQGIASTVCDTLLYSTNPVYIHSITNDNNGHFLVVYGFYSTSLGIYDSTIIVKSDNLNSLHGATIFRTKDYTIYYSKYKDGFIYGLDVTNNKIYKISTSTGSVSKIYSLDLTFSGFAINDFIVDNNGKVYFVSSQKNKVYSFTSATSVREIAGGSIAGHADGIGNQATFNYPVGISIANNGALYVSDANNHSIRKITLQ